MKENSTPIPKKDYKSAGDWRLGAPRPTPSLLAFLNFFRMGANPADVAIPDVPKNILSSNALHDVITSSPPSSSAFTSISAHFRT